MSSSRYEKVAISTTLLAPLTVLSITWWAPEGSEWRPQHLLEPRPGELHVQ